MARSKARASRWRWKRRPISTPRATARRTPKRTSLAIDGNPTGSAWTSEHYENETFAGTKTGPDPGVGLYLTTKAPAKPTEMVIKSAPGWDAQIYAAASAHRKNSPNGATRSARWSTPTKSKRPS